jgi:hypothetical protein
MMQDWTEFTGSPREVRRRNPRVTLSKYKDIYLNLKAYEALGRPERIQFFYDTARSRIGLRKSLHEDNNAFPVKKEPGSGSGATVHAAYFCNNYGIRPDRAIEFTNVTIDANGIMVLDLKTARSVNLG